MPKIVIYGAPRDHTFQFILGDGTKVSGKTGPSGFCQMELNAPIPSDATLSWPAFCRRLDGARSLQDAFCDKPEAAAGKRELMLVHAAIGALNGDANWWCLLKQAVDKYPESVGKINEARERIRGAGSQDPAASD